MSNSDSDIETYLVELEKHLVDDKEEEFVDSGNCGEDVNDDGGNENDFTQDFLNDDDIDNDELEDGTIFMDAEGNYYYQRCTKAVPVQPVKRKRSIKASQITLADAKREKPLPSPSQAKTKEKLKSSPNKSIPTPSKSPHKPACIKKLLDKKHANSGVSSKSETKLDSEIQLEKSSSAIKTYSIKIDPIAKIEKFTMTSTTVRDGTITSEINNDEEIYEFEVTERNIEDPDDPDYQNETIDNNDSNYVPKSKVKLKVMSLPKPDASGRYQCLMCTYNADMKFQLSQHLTTHFDQRPYKCSMCEKGFKTNTLLENHKNSHLVNKPHKCADCDKSFKTYGELSQHRRIRHNLTTPLKCTECDYSCLQLGLLRRHMYCHTGERRNQCPHCTYVARNTYTLKCHMRTHTGEKPYECDICHSRFTESNSLKYHRLRHSVKPVFQCNLCPTTCGRKTDLRSHFQKQHNTDNPVTCKRCSKVLPDRYSYKMHIKTHEGEKRYRCDVCTYASTSQHRLDTHMLLHTDSMPFSCELCERTFRKKAVLNQHIKVYHTENYKAPAPRKKTHICPHCERSFAFKGNLIRHMETHDPNSRHFEEKLALKWGRMKRILPDGRIVTIISLSLYPDEEVMDEEIVDKEFEMAEGKEEYDVKIEDNIQHVHEEYVGDGDELITGDKAEKILTQEKAPMTACATKPVQISPEVVVDDGQGYMLIEVMQAAEVEEQTTFVGKEQSTRIYKTSVAKSSNPKS